MKFFNFFNKKENKIEKKNTYFKHFFLFLQIISGPNASSADIERALGRGATHKPSTISNGTSVYGTYPRKVYSPPQYECYSPSLGSNVYSMNSSYQKAPIVIQKAYSPHSFYRDPNRRENVAIYRTSSIENF